jgi:cytochrome o ubiquinol oxidase operon protein cyoD
MKPVQLHAPLHAARHGSLGGYTIGLALSLLLTLGSFAAVMTGLIPRGATLVVIVILCVAQLFVQLVFFLHLGASPDQRANTGIFVCTGLLIAVVVAGSLWVTHNANVNMMPTQMSAKRAISHD